MPIKSTTNYQPNYATKNKEFNRKTASMHDSKHLKGTSLSEFSGNGLKKVGSRSDCT